MSGFDYKEYWAKRWYNPLDIKDEAALAVLENTVQGTVLDIGCGAGRFRPLFGGFNYTGFDINESNIEIAKIIYKGKFKVGDIVTDKLRKYDNIFCWHVLNHIPTGYLSEVVEKINKSGKRLLIGGMKNFKGDSQYIFHVDYHKLFNVEKEIPMDKNFSLYVCKGKA